MPEVVELLKEKHLLEESDGAQVVRFEEDRLPPCIILKSDGTTIYATRDLAAAIYRKRTYDFYKNVYVVGCLLYTSRCQAERDGHQRYARI